MGQLGDHQKEKYPEQERHPFPEPAARVHTLNPFRDSLWSRAGPMCSATKGVSGSLFGKIYSGTPLSSGGEESLAKQKNTRTLFCVRVFCCGCPTRIRTQTNRVRVCRATFTQSGIVN